MDVVQDGFAAAFERNRVRGDRDEETEAIAAVVRRLSGIVRNGVIERYPGVAARVLHYAFGCGFAVGYVALRARAPWVAAGDGVAFGVGLWVLSDVVLVPAAHLGRPLMRYSRAERANALLAHLAYAITVEAVVRRIG